MDAQERIAVFRGYLREMATREKIMNSLFADCFIVIEGIQQRE